MSAIVEHLRLRDILLRETRAIESLVGEMEAELQSFGPRKLATVMQLMLTHLWLYLNALSSSPGPEQWGGKVYGDLLSKIRRLHEDQLAYLAVTPGMSSSSEVLLPLVSLAGMFAIKSFSISVRPSEHYRFGLRVYRSMLQRWDEDLFFICRRAGVTRPALPALVDAEGRELKLPDLFVELEVPFSQGRDVLMLCLLGHEFGHITNSTKEPTEELSSLLYCRTTDSAEKEKKGGGLLEKAYAGLKKERDALAAVLQVCSIARNAELARLEGKFNPGSFTLPQKYASPLDVEQTTIYLGWEIISKNWFKELVADAYALRVLGPAYLFALWEHAWTVVPDPFRCTHLYPSHAIRLHYLLKSLQTMGYIKRAEPKAPSGQDDTRTPEGYTATSAESYLQRIVDTGAVISGKVMPAAADHHMYGIPFHFVEFGMESIVLPEVHNDGRVKTFTASAYKTQVDDAHLGDRFAEGVPPSDSWTQDAPPNGEWKNEPHNTVAILNAAWLACVGHLDKFVALVTNKTGPAERADAILNFHDLVLKALESSETFRTWKRIDP